MTSHTSVLVVVRTLGGTGYFARAGKGKAAKTASSTSSAEAAAERAAAKYLDPEYCTSTITFTKLERVSGTPQLITESNKQFFRYRIPAAVEGGAS